MAFPMSSAAPTAKKNLFCGLKALWKDTEPTVLITYEWPTQGYPHECVALLEASSAQSPGPSSGSNRTRDETLVLSLGISVFKGGGGGTPEQNSALVQAVEERAYKLAADIENYVRVTDTTLVGPDAPPSTSGPVLWCFMTSHQVNSFPTIENETEGIVCELTLALTAQVRISS